MVGNGVLEMAENLVRVMEQINDFLISSVDVVIIMMYNVNIEYKMKGW